MKLSTLLVVAPVITASFIGACSSNSGTMKESTSVVTNGNGGTEVYYCTVALTAANGGGTGCYSCSIGYVPSGSGESVIVGCGLGASGGASTLAALEATCSSLAGSSGISALATDCPTSTPTGCCETMTKTVASDGVATYSNAEECYFGSASDGAKTLCSDQGGTWSDGSMN